MNNHKRIPTIGLIGLGNQGRKHLDSILSLQSRNLVKLVGLCDRFLKQASHFTNVSSYLDYKDLYFKEKPEIIIIATPNYLHKQMSLDALNKGIHVIKEKPLALNYYDACEILEASQSVNKLIITMQQRFFSPLFLKAKEIISTLGKIVNFSYRFTLNDTAKSWYWDIDKAGGGSWLNMGWHAISAVQWLFGDIKAVELSWKVNGKREWDYKTDHSSFAKVFLKRNVVGSIFVSCVYPKKEETLKVVFSDGILYLNRNYLTIFRKGEKEKSYYSNIDEHYIYTVQLEEMLSKIRVNTYDQLQDLKTMAVIQAGINSAHHSSLLTNVEKLYREENSVVYLDTAYADL